MPDVPARHSGQPLPVKTLPTAKRWPYQVMTFVEWCGHQQEVALVPDGAEWYAEIPVLGEAR